MTLGETPKIQRFFPGAFALLVMVLAVYLPVMKSAGFIWDDDDHVTNNGRLRNLDGLETLWLHPSSIPQYYPVVHTTFWIEFHLWGLKPTGYHIDNVLLHALAAILLWRALRRLEIPAAFLAAAIFAVHPVQVESVAWVTERKNVLSLVFYLLSFHAYLRCAGDDLRSGWDELGREAEELRKDAINSGGAVDLSAKASPSASLSPTASRRWRAYALSIFFYILALLSKSVTCSLPAAILLLIYFSHGRLRWRDWRPLIPFFALGIAMSMVTGYIEKYRVGASGPEWDFSVFQRCLIAGRAVWFYAGKLVWPSELSFNYPRWNVDADQWPKFIAYPLAALAVVAIAWFLRKRIGRGPLVGILFFVGTLTPALGFVNVFPMRFSFVADHFQYHASIGLIVLLAVMLRQIALGLSREISLPMLAPIGPVIVLAIFGALAWRQAGVYRDPIALWKDTLAKNPTSFLALNNLGDEYKVLANQPGTSAAQKAEYRALARECYAKEYQVAPNQAIAHWQWGLLLEEDGDLDDARKEMEIAVEKEPRFVLAMNSLASIFLKKHDPAAADQMYQRLLAIEPRFALARYNYAVELEAEGKFDEAIAEYQQAIRDKPDEADALYNLGNLLLTKKQRPDLAAVLYAEAISVDPDRADFHAMFALALYNAGDYPDARQQCQAALKIDPNLPQAQRLLPMLGR
jgi:Tfp pilus assembly protein PilF